MAHNIVIRTEIESDYQEIYDITKCAFAPMPYSDGDEQDLINALRAGDALEISLVAEIDQKIVGHIAFSRAYCADGADRYYALGPVAVEPVLQKSGIGSALINAGIDILRMRDAACCILVGDINYYTRFGFKPAPHLCPDNEPAKFYMIMELNQIAPKHIIEFHPLFYGQE